GLSEARAARPSAPALHAGDGALHVLDLRFDVRVHQAQRRVHDVRVNSRQCPAISDETESVLASSRRLIARETAMVGKIKAAAKAVTDLAGDTLAAGLGQVEASLEELSAASPDLEELGYQLGQIELACTLPPRLIIYLARHGKASKEAYQG